MAGSEVLGNAVIPIRAVLDKLDADLAKAKQKVDGTMASMGDRMQTTGKKLSRTLTPAALAVGAAMKGIGDDWHAGVNEIITGTGAAGDELDALTDSMKRVASKVPQDMGEVGKAIAELNTRLGLTGPELETMSKKMLDLARITKKDVGTTVESTTRLFGDWNVAAEDQVATLDKLVKAGQVTGIGVDRLNGLMVQFGAPMRELGFSFDESAAMLGKFEKEGVNVELVLGGLKQGLGRLTKAGKNPREEIDKLQASISEAGLTAENKSRVFEIFGTRAGIDMAKAMEEGRFELGDLVAQIEDSGGALDDASKRTLRYSDRLAMLRNRVTGAVGPFADMGMAVAGVAAGLGPAMIGVGKLTKGLPKLGRALSEPVVGLARLATASARAAASVAKATARMAVEAARATARVVAAIAVQVARWAVLGVQSKLAAAKVAAAWLISMGPIALVGAAVVGLVVLIVKNWDKIKKAIAAAWNVIKSGASAAWAAIKGIVSGGLNVLRQLFLNFTGPGIIIRHWDTIKRAGGAAVDFVRDKWNGLIGFFTGIPGRLASGAGRMWSWISDAFRAAINAVVGIWNNFRFPTFNIPRVSFMGKGVGGGSIGGWALPQMPRVAMGGDVTAGGIAEVGEWGRELVFLPGGASVTSHRASEQLLSRSGSMDDRPYVTKVIVDGRELFEVVQDRQVDWDRRNGSRKRVA